MDEVTIRKMEFVVFDHDELEEFIYANYPDLKEDAYSVRGDLFFMEDHHRMTYYYDFPPEYLPLLRDKDKEYIKHIVDGGYDCTQMTPLFIKDLIDKGILPLANYLIEVH